MLKKPKKLLCVLMSLIMIGLTVMPVFGAVNMFETKSQIPVIIISGDGNTIYDKDDKPLSKFSKLFGNNGGEGEDVNKEVVLESVANVLMPFLVDGILMDNWDPYFKNLQKEISELFGDILLDENGEASNGTHISQWCVDQNAYDVTYDRKGDKGFYAQGDYTFWYDWRLDPMYTADLFNEYIQGVKRATGSEKVSVLCRCLGTNVVCAYLEKYGYGDLYGLGFDGAVCMGAEPLGEAMSGKFKVDGNSIERVLVDGNYFGMFNLDPFILATVDLAQKSGLIDTAVGITKATLYEKLVEGVTSALALSSVSCPNYWACVGVEDFDTAVEYVFGKEGSEKRTTYAGLIEKITAYNEQVKKNIPSLLKALPENGVKVGVIAKYGLQMIPTCESAEVIADSFVSTTSSSFGATTGTVYNTLSDEYIASQNEKGLGKYVSPDKQIDASTCIFPDNTWFVKGVKHSDWTYAENMLLTTVITSDRQLTVDDFAETQFMVKHPTYWWAMTAMTEDNCHTEAWAANEKVDKPTTKHDKLSALLGSILDWLNHLIRIISEKFTSIGKKG